MKSSTGRWVSGDDFFDRDSELTFARSARARPQPPVGGRAAAHGQDQHPPGARTSFGVGRLGVSVRRCRGSDIPGGRDRGHGAGSASRPRRGSASGVGHEALVNGERRRDQRARIRREVPRGSRRRKLAPPRRGSAAGLRGGGQAGAAGRRRTAHFSEAPATARRPCGSGRRVPQLAARRAPGARGRQSGPDRLGQHRA